MCVWPHTGAVLVGVLERKLQSQTIGVSPCRCRCQKKNHALNNESISEQNNDAAQRGYRHT